MRRIDVAIAIVCRQQKVLICRRKIDTHLGGFWEFPGGKVQDGETITQCLARELREELDIEVEALTALPIIEHDYADRLVRLHPFLCAFRSGDVKPLGCELAIWISQETLGEYPFPPANKELIEQLLQYFKTSDSKE